MIHFRGWVQDYPCCQGRLRYATFAFAHTWLLCTQAGWYPGAGFPCSLKTWFNPTVFDILVTVFFQAAVLFIGEFVSKGAREVSSMVCDINTLLSSKGYLTPPKHWCLKWVSATVSNVTFAWRHWRVCTLQWREGPECSVCDLLSCSNLGCNLVWRWWRSVETRLCKKKRGRSHGNRTNHEIPSGDIQMEIIYLFPRTWVTYGKIWKFVDILMQSV